MRTQPTIAFSETEPVVTGIYLLFKKGDLIYIGRSDNIYRRIADHRSGGRSFDYALVVATPKHDSVWIERALHRATRNRSSPLKDAGGDVVATEKPSPAPSRVVVAGPPLEAAAPDVISVGRAWDYLRSKGYPLRVPFQAALADGTLKLVTIGRRRMLLRADVDAWALSELVRLGFNVENLIPRRNGEAAA